MCGIFGIVAPAQTLPDATIKRITDQLFTLSESRGKEASGVAARTDAHLIVAKYALPASVMIKRPQHQTLIKQALATQGTISIIGHSRLVTNGSARIHSNNQPVMAERMVGIHNGIITNVDALWQRYQAAFQPTSDLDTEVLLRLVRHFYQQTQSLAVAVQRAYAELEGVASVALLFEDFDALLLATNNGSLYTARHPESGAFLFASERYIVEQTLQGQQLEGFRVQHMAAGDGLLLHLDDLNCTSFGLKAATLDVQALTPQPLQHSTVDYSVQHSVSPAAHIPGSGPYVLAPSFVDHYPQIKAAVDGLRRCTRCILPETMPFITFDDAGVCNFCRSYTPMQPLGVDALRERLAPYRKADGSPELLIPFSGGRDSSYTLHFVTVELGLKPLTYTYDWGMVTDLARRNQMRMCGALGVEHILVSANIDKKRANIRKNVLAWLRQPDLGMVPLFMAGDKQYFYHANRIADQNGLSVNLLGENLLETTRFKTGFAGLAPKFDGNKTYSLSLAQKFRLAAYYGRHYLTNPRYLNQSVLDTVGAFASYYVISHHANVNLFDYIRWDEATITGVLLNQYNWETATDTQSTWRIGDGTAAFYNYIYYAMAGITENDTFRSNQIREGMLTRAQALALSEQENQPRYESMQWYCDVIGIDFEQAIKRINAAARLYGGKP